MVAAVYDSYKHFMAKTTTTKRRKEILFKVPEPQILQQHGFYTHTHKEKNNNKEIRAFRGVVNVPASNINEIEYSIIHSPYIFW